MGRRMFSEKQIEKMAKEVAVQEVEELVEGGTLDNAKPIYCHPITIQISATHKARLTMLIFNNSPTEFTLDTLKQWLDNLITLTSNRVRIMCSGACSHTKGPTDAPVQKTLIVSSLDKTTANNYTIAGVDIDGVVNAFTDANWSYIFPEGTSIVDGVNKIN